MANTRVKVPRTVLIERIQETIDRETKEHADRLAEYEKEVADFIGKLPGALEKRGKEIAALKTEEFEDFVQKTGKSSYDTGSLVRVPLSVPRFEPKHYDYKQRGYTYHHGFKSYIESLEKSKRVLEASTDEFISVSANDEYANYL